MSHVRLFQVFVIINWLLYLGLFFLPIGWLSGDPRIVELLSLDGSYSSLAYSNFRLYVPLPGGFLFALPLWGFLFASIGLIFFQNWGRYLYLALWLGMGIGILFFGIRVSHPVQGLITFLVGALDGAILAIAFLSPLGACFEASPRPKN